MPDIEAGIRAAAGRDAQAAIDGFMAVKEWMDQRGILTPRRRAHLFGQCAHESVGYTRTIENLNYSAHRLMVVWPRRFPTLREAEQYARQPKMLANKVYGGRMGNREPGDGWRYRGRGWLQLTGRNNYRQSCAPLGIDLEAQPEIAREPSTAWRIAARYLGVREWAGKTALEWADENNTRQVTRIVNGGLNGLDDRIKRTAAALAVLERTL